MASTLPKLITWAPVGRTHGSSTPFGIKVELALRLAGIDYTVEPGNPLKPKSMPKQKFPVLQHGDKLIPDSSAIFKHLHEAYPDKMALFTPQDAKKKALALSLQGMLEERTYFAVLYTLWKSDEVSSAFVPAMLRSVADATGSSVLRSLTPVLKHYFKSKLIRDLNGQGVGKHSMQEVLKSMDADLAACETLLEASGAFLTGTNPTQADCFLYGVVDHALNAGADIAVPLLHTKLVQEKPALMAFHKRLTATAFASGRSEQWEQCCG